ncbi:MAG TPA: ABC transporter ATP-binding protein [Nevskiaceae bacterium]
MTADAAVSASPPALSLVGVSKSFPGPEKDFLALQDIHLKVGRGEFVSILGPSGCGKSTLLYIIGGFILATHGSIHANGRLVDAPGRDRGLVFQDAALFPWLTVRGNIAYGLREGGMKRGDVNRVVHDMLSLVHLDGFADFYPKQLSGGMRQRVAIARTLAYDPGILLMDEPFGALDAYTRSVLQDELLRIQDSHHKTIVFVTHSVDEAVYLSDRVVVLDRSPGRVHSEVNVDLPRPRRRQTLLRDERYQQHVIDLGSVMMAMHADA